MAFTVTPAGKTAAPNAHTLERNAQRAGEKPSAMERALKAAMTPTGAPQQAPEPLSTTETAQALRSNQEQPQASNEPSGQLPNIEAPKAETSPEPAKAPTEAPKETLSTQYAQLARKERALRARAQELKQREEALKAQAEPKPTPTANGIPLEEFKKNPWKFMQDAGISYDQITQQALNAPSPEQQQQQQLFDTMQSKIAELESKLNGQAKTWEESQKTQYQQAVHQIKSDVTSLVNSNESFETIKATDSISDVVELIEKTFHADGYLMSVEEAAQQVEDYLAEEAYKLSQLKKIQSRLKSASATAPAATSKLPEVVNQQSQPSKTLSNAMTGSRQLTARERAMAAAIHGPNWRDKI